MDITMGDTVTIPDGRHAEVLGRLHRGRVLVQVRRLALMPLGFELEPSELAGCTCEQPNPWGECSR